MSFRLINFTVTRIEKVIVKNHCCAKSVFSMDSILAVERPGHSYEAAAGSQKLFIYGL